MHHRPQPQIALVSSYPSTGEITTPEAPPRSHPSTCEIVPPEALPRWCCLKHHRDRNLAPARSHPWPTHAWSLSFSIYLSLSLNCRSLSLPPSLCWTKFLSLMNVLFCFLFLLSLYIEIFYHEICLEAEKIAEKMWEISRKITFSECNQTLENIFFFQKYFHLKIFYIETIIA